MAGDNAIGGVISGLFNLGGQFASNASNARQNRKSRNWQEHMYDRQLIDAENMWNKQNAYNEEHSSPAYMMQRYKDAGLSPWLVYGQPNRVEAGSIQKPTVGQPRFEPSKWDLGGAVAQGLATLLQKKQIQSMDADIRQKNAGTANIQAQTAQTLQNTSFGADLQPGVKERQGYENQGLKSQNDKLIAEIEQIGINQEKSRAEIQNIKQNTAGKLVEIQNLVKQGKIQDAELRAKQMANQLFQSTMQSKSDAENAYNRLMSETSGMGKASISQMPGIIIGSAYRILRENQSTPKEKDEKKKWIKRNFNNYFKNGK